MILCLRDNFQIFFQESRNLGKKLISQQDRLLESRRSETILHCLDVDRVSWSQIYDWISCSRLIMMKCMPRPRQMYTSFRARVPMLVKYQKCALAEGTRSKYITLAFVMAYECRLSWRVSTAVRCHLRGNSSGRETHSRYDQTWRRYPIINLRPANPIYVKAVRYCFTPSAF